MSQLYIGLISGTSADGIDVALVDFATEKPHLLACGCQPFPEPLKQQIQHLSLSEQPLLLSDYGALDSQLGLLFANATNHLLKKSGFKHTDIQAIGSHGQTVYHQPNHEYPFSLQLGDPNIIAERTHITTVADFRRRDIACGGQGAPLVPAFHQALFGSLSKKFTVVNIGGIANITILSEEKIIAFDTGTGNTLMDYWCYKYLSQTYDKQGEWAKSGKPLPKLLALLKEADYFKLLPPKSTGTEYFSSTWLESKVNGFTNANPEDVQATLCYFTADTILEAVKRYAPHTEELLICGGGVHNLFLLDLLKRYYRVNSTEKYGVHPDYMEAMAFAWLAKQTLHKLPGNLPEVTGAKSAVILGAIYPG